MMQVPFTVTFLGTGTSGGVPMVACNCVVCTSSNSKDKRLRSSILIRTATTTVVIDTTPDFRQQMLRENVQQLDAIVYTHPHKDHIAGLDDVRAYNYFSSKAMPIYVNAITEKRLRNEFDYAFAEALYEGVPQLQLMPITPSPFTIGDIHLTPILVMHYKMPVYGYRIGSFTYITDANAITEVERNKIRGSQVMVINTLRKEPHLAHFTLQEALQVVQDVGVPQAYGTHISHMLGTHEQLSAELPAYLQLAYDGLQLQF